MANFVPKSSNGASLGLPAYQRIEDDIREQIRSGSWALGATLPSRRDLARQYGVQLPTLQRAVSALLADGTLVATARQGTMVAKADSVDRFSGTDQAPRVSKSERHMTVGIIALISLLPNLRSDGRNYNGTIVDAIEATLAAADVSSAYFSREKHPGDDASSVRDALAQSVDALVFVLTLDSAEMINTALDLVERLTIPVIFVTPDPIGAPYSTVCFEQVSAGYRAAQHLVRNNAERIIYLAPFKAKWLDERIQGAKDALARAAFPMDAFSVYPETSDLDPWKEDHEQLSRRAARQLAEDDRLRGTSIIACNDTGAVALAEVAREYGLEAGVDYQIVGFDDTVDARENGISSVRPPAAAMGDEAAKLVLRQLRGETAILQVSLQSHLVVRSSSKPLPRLVFSQPRELSLI